MKLYKHIQHPFKSISGVTWTACGVERYNRLIDKQNGYLKAGREIPENILNESHNCFVQNSQLYSSSVAGLYEA